MSPLELVRKNLQKALGVPIEAGDGVELKFPHKRTGDRAHLYMRVERKGAMAVLATAKRSGLSPGDDMAELIAGVPLLPDRCAPGRSFRTGSRSPTISLPVSNVQRAYALAFVQRPVSLEAAARGAGRE